MKENKFRKDLFNFILDNIDITEVISKYIKLRPAGFYLKGACPFNKEEDDTFTVNPSKRIFFCFNCHASGDVVRFISKIKDLDREEAAIYLIKKYIVGKGK